MNNIPHHYTHTRYFIKRWFTNFLIYKLYMSYILDYLNCSNITECYQITNECCKNINKFRQYERTKDETIIVGLELPNQQGKLIRFVPRNITIITKQG